MCGHPAGGQPPLRMGTRLMHAYVNVLSAARIVNYLIRGDAVIIGGTPHARTFPELRDRARALAGDDDAISMTISLPAGVKASSAMLCRIVATELRQPQASLQGDAMGRRASPRCSLLPCPCADPAAHLDRPARAGATARRLVRPDGSAAARRGRPTASSGLRSDSAAAH